MPNGCGRSTRAARAPTSGRGTTTSGSQHSPQDLLLADPGPRDMFDDRVYKRGALTLHVLRRTHRRREFLCAAAGLDRPATVTAPSSPTTSPGLAANYAHESLRPLWDAWLYSTGFPRWTRHVTDARTPATGPVTRAQRGPGRHGDGAVRAVRLRGALPGRPRSRAGRVLGVRRVLGRVRAGHRRGVRPAAGGDPGGALGALHRGRRAGRERTRCGWRRWSAWWPPR